jgi:AraC-like DNA-binding protein
MQAVFHQIEQTNKNEFFCGIFKTATECPLPHFHKTYEIILVTEGKATCTVGDRSYVINKGQFAFVAPFQTHFFTLEEKSEAISVDIHEHLILTISQTIIKKKLTNAVFDTARAEFEHFVAALTESMPSSCVTYQRIAPLSLRLKIKGLLYFFLSDIPEKGEWVALSSTDSVIIDILQYISEKFTKDISLKDIAKDKGYNYQYLSRTFNQTLGISFKKLLNQYRMEFAFAQLQDTNLPLSQIAFESGFQSIRSFDHICQTIYGKSPMDLRREQRNKAK